MPHVSQGVFSICTNRLVCVTEVYKQMLVSMPHICPELFSTHAIE